jgi:hypothetical protein
MENRSAQILKNVLENKTETLKEISQIHYSVEFPKIIEALKDSVHFAVMAAGEIDHVDDSKYFFDHMKILADIMHYVSSVEHILNVSKDIEEIELRN